MAEHPLQRADALMDRRRRLRSKLGEWIGRGASRPRGEDEFNRLALEVFRYQVEANETYGAFAEVRGAGPDRVHDWRQIPPVPARAFKEIPDRLVAPGPVEAVFRTSGTTAGARRGEHRIRDLSLYRASLLATATAYLRPEIERAEGSRPGHGLPPIRILALLPAPRDAPDSSLSHMAGVLVEEWDDGSGGFFLAGDGSVLREEWERALRKASAAGTPVMVLATAFSLVAWMEGRRTGAGPALTASSLVMETGGYKGRVRSVPKPELYARVAATLQIPEARIVAEYGMTEMLSQFYEPQLVDASPAAPAERRFVGPPWVATRILEPSTLEPVPPGEPGLLSHLDLANLDSVAAILTEDEGIEWKDGFRVLGRIRGGEPRGCSLAVEDLLSAGGANG